MLQQVQDRPQENGRLALQDVHLAAIERVIETKRAHLCEPLLLEDMADVACLSPYYFSRVFHQIISIPPGEFLSTLRLDMAKRLLLTTSLSVTEICFEVGYIGLGSFTTRFTQQIGIPPRHLRRLAGTLDAKMGSEASPIPAPALIPPTIKVPSPLPLSGQVYYMDGFQGCIYLG